MGSVDGTGCWKGAKTVWVTDVRGDVGVSRCAGSGWMAEQQWRVCHNMSTTLGIGQHCSCGTTC